MRSGRRADRDRRDSRRRHRLRGIGRCDAIDAARRALRTRGVAVRRHAAALPHRRDRAGWRPRVRQSVRASNAVRRRRDARSARSGRSRRIRAVVDRPGAGAGAGGSSAGRCRADPDDATRRRRHGPARRRRRHRGVHDRPGARRDRRSEPSDAGRPRRQRHRDRSHRLPRRVGPAASALRASASRCGLAAGRGLHREPDHGWQHAAGRRGADPERGAALPDQSQRSRCPLRHDHRSTARADRVGRRERSREVDRSGRRRRELLLRLGAPLRAHRPEPGFRLPRDRPDLRAGRDRRAAPDGLDVAGLLDRPHGPGLFRSFRRAALRRRERRSPTSCARRRRRAVRRSSASHRRPRTARRRASGRRCTRAMASRSHEPTSTSS